MQQSSDKQKQTAIWSRRSASATVVQRKLSCVCVNTQCVARWRQKRNRTKKRKRDKISKRSGHEKQHRHKIKKCIQDKKSTCDKTKNNSLRVQFLRFFLCVLLLDFFSFFFFSASFSCLNFVTISQDILCEKIIF